MRASLLAEDGEPVRTRRFRRIVSMLQTFFLLLALALLVLWALHEGNGEQIVQRFIRWSSSIHEWVLSRTRYPWED